MGDDDGCGRRVGDGRRVTGDGAGDRYGAGACIVRATYGRGKVRCVLVKSEKNWNASTESAYLVLRCR